MQQKNTQLISNFKTDIGSTPIYLFNVLFSFLSIKQYLNYNRLKIFLFICIVFLHFSAFTQDSIVVKGRFIDNTKYAKVLVKKFDVGSFVVGGVTIKEDSFKIVIPSDIDPGVYRFVYSVSEGEQYLDIIINGKEKEITFSIKANNALAEPVFTASEENKKWYAYKSLVNAQLIRIDLLNQFINAYPNSKSNVVQVAIKEWEMEKETYFKNFNEFKDEMFGSWAYEMVINRPYYFADPLESPRLQDYYKREHFWDGFNANNPSLINTPLYTEHILNYLRYWMNPNMNFSPDEKTNGFKRSADAVIRQFAGNEKTHDFAYKYLTLGFKEIGEEEVLQYIDENYKDLANRCFDNFEKTEFDKRMEGYATLKVGNLAPDFQLNIESGNAKVKSLFKLKSEKTLIVFWSSSCPHCMEEMPKLNEWAVTQIGLTVIAVSLDINSEIHKESIKKFPNMIHTCDYKGWDTEAAAKYYIAATPTFVLLDKDKRILGKYSKWESLK